MLKIRLQRFGKKNQPTFRVVLVDSQRSAKSGNFKEILGSIHFKDGTTLNVERIKHWMGLGAQLSDRVHNLMIKEGALVGAKRDVSSKKNVGKKEAEAKEAEAKEAVTPEAVVEEKADLPAEEAGAPTPEVKEEVKEEVAEKEEAPQEEAAKEEAPTPVEAEAPEAPAEEKVEEAGAQETSQEEKKEV